MDDDDAYRMDGVDEDVVSCSSAEEEEHTCEQLQHLFREIDVNAGELLDRGREAQAWPAAGWRAEASPEKDSRPSLADPGQVRHQSRDTPEKENVREGPQLDISPILSAKQRRSSGGVSSSSDRDGQRTQQQHTGDCQTKMHTRVQGVHRAQQCAPTIGFKLPVDESDARTAAYTVTTVQRRLFGAHAHLQQRPTDGIGSPHRLFDNQRLRDDARKSTWKAARTVRRPLCDAVANFCESRALPASIGERLGMGTEPVSFTSYLRSSLHRACHV